MQQVASYILTLQGTTPVVAKEAQGDACGGQAPVEESAETVEEVMN